MSEPAAEARDERPIIDFGSMSIVPNGGDISAIVYWPCNHPRPIRWWHRLRGQGTHLVYLDTLPAASGETITLQWDTAGHLTIGDEEP